MSLEMGIVPSGAELRRATVVALLSRLLGDDPELREGVAAGKHAEPVWDGERISTQWFIHPGTSGISELVVSIWDAYPTRPAGPYRDEVARLVELLQELAQATGGRFVVEEGDGTGTPLGEVLDMISPVESTRLPGMVYADPSGESGEDYLRRYLAAADDRLALLRERSTASGTPLRLDYSRDSLVALWAWAIDQLRPRPTDAPREKVMLENGDVFQRPTGAVLPMWYGRSAFLAPYIWSDDSLALFDAMSFYALECVRHAVPGLTWRLGHDETRGYQHQHEGQAGSRTARAIACRSPRNRSRSASRSR